MCKLKETKYEIFFKVIEERSRIPSWIRIQIRTKMSRIPNSDFKNGALEKLRYQYLFFDVYIHILYLIASNFGYFY